MLNFGSYKIARFLPNRVVATHGSGSSKVLYLTFDDGPNPEFTKKICELLDAYSAKGTFFCVGNQIAKHPEIASYLVENGHQLANHSQTHKSFAKQSLDSQLAEANDCQNEIEKIEPNNHKMFRAPQGLLSFPLLMTLLKRNWNIVHWSFDSKDYQQKPFEEQIKIFETRPAKSGDILLFHDDSQLACDLLAHMLPIWKEQGFKFNTTSELVGG